MKFSGIIEILLLMALGIGYIIIYFAQREEKLMQFTGYILGGVIIILAAAHLFANLMLGLNLNKNAQRQCRQNIIRQHMIQQERMMKQRRGGMMPEGMMQQAPVPK